MKNLEDRQRDMRERQPEMTEGTQHDMPVSLAETLEKIKAAPLKTAEEHMAVMRLIDKAEKHLDPTEVLLLQIEAILKHYALNKRPEDPEMTMADALLLREKSKLLR